MNKHVLPVLPALAAALAILAAPPLAPAALAADGPLSEGCATLHAHEGSTTTATSGQVQVSGTFRAGEQVRFTVTGNAPIIAPTTPGGGSLIQATSGEPTRYDVTTDGPIQFIIGASGGGGVSLTSACGIPPKATITSPTPGQDLQIGLFRVPSFSCTAGTNPVQDCATVPDQFDVSPGTHTFTVTATDASGLSSSTSVGYTMHQREQVLSFADPTPTDVTWGQFPYFVQATSSVGLPVTISVDPASTGCVGETGVADPFVAVSFPKPGTCIIHADQAGTDEYAAAPQITQSFTVGKHKSYVTTTKASKGLLGLTPTTFRASLDVDTFIGVGPIVSGYPGAKVTFSIAGKPMCTATTVVVPSDNPFITTVTATCKATIGLGNALKNTYTASFAGDDLYLPGSAVGKLQ